MSPFTNVSHINPIIVNYLYILNLKHIRMSDDGRGDVREERRDEERTRSPPRDRSASPPRERREEPNEDAKLFIGNLSFEASI